MGRYRYNVYDGERRIGTGLLPAQVRELLDMPGLKPARYAGHDYLIDGRYTIRREADDPESADTFGEQWEEAVRPFRGIQWVEHGGFDLNRAWRRYLDGIKKRKGQ